MYMKAFTRAAMVRASCNIAAILVLLLAICQQQLAAPTIAAAADLKSQTCLNSHAVIHGEVTPHVELCSAAGGPSSSANCIVHLSVSNWSAGASVQTLHSDVIHAAHLKGSDEPDHCAAGVAYSLAATCAISAEAARRCSAIATHRAGAQRLDIDLSKDGAVVHLPGLQTEYDIESVHASSPGLQESTAEVQRQPSQKELFEMAAGSRQQQLAALISSMLQGRCVQHDSGAITCTVQPGELLAIVAIMMLSSTALTYLAWRRPQMAAAPRAPAACACTTQVQQQHSSVLTLELDDDQTSEGPPSSSQMTRQLTLSGSLARVPRPSFLLQRRQQPSGEPPAEQGPASQSQQICWDGANIAGESSLAHDRNQAWKRQGRRLMRDSTALFLDAVPEGGSSPAGSPTAMQHMSCGLDSV